MRIKEEIKKSGYFWRPSEPDRKLHGTLSISDGGHIELEVTGQFGGRLEVSLNTNLNPIERIVGHIEKDEAVTLDGCYYKTLPHSLTGGISKSLIRVSRVLIGAAYDEDEPTVFNTLTFSVAGIDEWVGISGISVDHQYEERTATISYQPPEEISINLGDDMRLLITFHWTLPGFPIIKEAKISQKTYFKLVSEEERELKEFASVAHKITNFLCFAMAQTVSLDGMEVTSDNLRRNIGEGRTSPIPINIYYSSWPYSKNEPEIYRHRMLFGFEQIQNDAEEKIKNWIGLYKQIEPALDLYFLAKMGAQPTLTARFLALAQGLEICHRGINGGRREFGKRLEDITQPFEDIIRNQTTREELISTIVNTRNYWTHYDRSLESKAAKDEDLSLLCLKMELLFQLHFLQLIGFSREQIDSFLADSIPLRQRSQLL